MNARDAVMCATIGLTLMLMLAMAGSRPAVAVDVRNVTRDGCSTHNSLLWHCEACVAPWFVRAPTTIDGPTHVFFALPGNEAHAHFNAPHDVTVCVRCEPPHFVRLATIPFMLIVAEFTTLDNQRRSACYMLIGLVALGMRRAFHLAIAF